jgi:hypothetical protein
MLAFVLLKDAATRFTWVAPADIDTPEAHLHRDRKTRTTANTPDGNTTERAVPTASRDRYT